MQEYLRRLCALLCVFAAVAVQAQDYPQRPIRMIIGLPPGGSTDIMGRQLAAKLAERFGQQVVVDNRAGASGIIGAELVAKSQPDGYTLMMAGGSFGTISSLYTKLSFDTTRDFAPIALFATSPYVFVVHPSLPVNSMQEFFAYAKARPGQINFAGSTPGSVQRLSGELLKRTVGFDMLYVPYKGTGVLLPDLIGGRLQAAIDNVLVVVPYMKSGALRGLAVTSAKRSVVVPELPTIAESGAPGFQSGGWFGVLGAAGTPPAIIKKLNAEISSIMQQADVRDRLLAQGAEPLWGPPDELKKLLARERELWSKVIREAGIKPD
ncbi:MAG: tripartite tricarboxylate transporter substrate binding protein [Betaproteobacteria bacterium]|nr:tripartite tricarboxylate transporter substrate binding protein [Betaproteobacteria bacterium]